MDGYPNSDEEFELQYADELELLREQPGKLKNKYFVLLNL